MTKLSDLMNPVDLVKAISAGFVREQFHPSLQLMIFNYAEKAVFEREWTSVTRQCRGLIVHTKTNEVIARPFPKFFNHGEPLAPIIALNEPVLVTDKVDGSLGILYPTGDGGHAVATRGSFTSEQAQHATSLYQERYAGRWEPQDGKTYLFEIVYPQNRIVVDYRGLDDLVLLGVMDVRSGLTSAAADCLEWIGPRVQEFTYPTFAAALDAGPRDGREGLVVEAFDGTRVKVKYEEYVRLHKIVTGLNARAVWEAIGAGQNVGQICAEIPDEFHEWTKEVAFGLVDHQEQIILTAVQEHTRIVASLPEGHTRKDYALVAKESPLRGYLFRLADGRKIDDIAWKAVYPEGNVTPSGRTFTEATA